MCGICGKIRFDGRPVEQELIEKMCGAIAYRGPDDKGVETISLNGGPPHRSIRGVLGHRRLSIIDLSPAGHQPMKTDDGSVMITYNGEIYNFKELKAELIQKGYTFHSNTDTEVILHLYREEGLQAVHRLNGMFAFALWDQKKSRLWICRDRIGIKPLIYFWDGIKFLFASEIKALLCDPEIPKEIDNEALRLYLTFSYIPAPFTIFQNIHKLEPGHHLVLENGNLHKTRYWDIAHHPESDVSTSGTEVKEREYEKRLLEALSDAVKVRMIADVPLGAFLSGGIDSSIIVALMAMHSPTPVQTFSIGFKEDALYDETRYARDVAKRYRTDHHEFQLTHKALLDVFPDVLSTFDEPFADSSAVPTYIVSRETRKHVTVALSGDGGDELFAGYRSYLGEYWRPYYFMIPPWIRINLFERAVLRLPDGRTNKCLEYIRRIKKFIRGSYGSFPERVLSLKEIFPGRIIEQIIAQPHAEFADLSLKWIQHKLPADPDDRINSMLISDVKDSLPGDMLNKVDWMSMKNSLEVRVPFLDHRVVELAFQIPGSMKIQRGKTKYLLKKTFKKLLPVSLHHRSKAGFEIPISRWLKTDLKFLLDEYLDEKHISEQGIFRYPIIGALKHNHLRNKSDTSWLLWNLIVFQYWHKQYME